MRSTVYKLAIGLPLAIIVAGVSVEDYRIVGGTKVVDDLPWMVQLYSVVTEETDEGLSIGLGQCGGTLISPNWILTAAHCALNSNNQLDTSTTMPDPSNPGQRMYTKYAYVGSNYQALTTENPNLDQQLQEAAPITKVVCHPQFNVRTLENDICLYRLQKPSNNTPVVLNLGQNYIAESQAPGQTGVILGWGRTEENGTSSALDLKRAEVPIKPVVVCTKEFKKQENVLFYSKTVLCAGGVEGIDTCQGDSGGPMTTLEYKQIGITSFGFGCARANLPAVYTKVSSYKSFIEATTGLNYD